MNERVYEAPKVFEVDEENIPGLEFTNGSTQSMTSSSTSTQCNCSHK